MEKRAHPRYPLRVNATVRVQGFRPCAGTVRDFCQGGMFLALAPEEMARLSPPSRPLARDSALAVDVTLPADGAQRKFMLRARVARVLEQGLGVAFVNPDPDALMALARRAEQTSKGRGADRPNGTAARASRDGARAVAAIRQVLAEHLSGIVPPFFASAEKELEAAADAGGNFITQGHLLDGSVLLRRTGKEIEAAFVQRVTAELPNPDGPGQDGSGGEAPETSTAPELTLIDQASFEDMLAATDIATRAEQRFREKLSELQRRLAAVLGLPADIGACPIGPVVFAEAFRRAVSERGFHRKALDLLYRVFERTVVGRLGQLYDRVNALLQEQGVEPVAADKQGVVPHPSNPRQAARERRRADRSSGESTAPLAPREYGPPQSVYPFPQAPWPSGAMRAEEYARAAAAAPIEGVATAAGGAPAGFFLPAGGVAGPPAAAQGPLPSAGGPAVSGGAVARSFLSAGGPTVPGGMDAGPAPPVGLVDAAGPAPSITTGPAGAGQVASYAAGPGVAPWASLPFPPSRADAVATSPLAGGVALTSPQRVPPAFPSARPAAAARALLGLARWARAATAPNAPPAGPGEAPPLATVADDAAAPPPSEEEVLEALTALQRGGVEAGPQADQTLLTRVLAELARTRPNGATPGLAPGQETAFELLDGLLHSVHEDAHLLEAVKQRVARLAVPLHKVALLDEDFLQDPAHPARRVLDQLDRLDPDDGESPGRGAALQRVDPIIQRIEQDFDRDLGVLEDGASALEDIIAGQAEQYRERVAEVIRASEVQQAMLRRRRTGAGAAASRPPPPELAEWVTQARRLRVGDRLELGAGTPKAQVARLAWIGEDMDPFVLVDRQGHKAAHLSLQEVAMELRRGTARLVQVPDAPLVERALDGVMERVHRRLEAQVGKDPSTGLLNVVGFERALAGALHDAGRRRVTHALCYLDLDRMRSLLDVHGPGAASRYVEAVAAALGRVLPENAQLARLGGDAFAVLLREGGIESARALGEACRGAVEEFRFEWDQTSVALTASVGLVLIDGEVVEPDKVLHAAQSACRAAKDAGANRVRVYQEQDEGVRRHEELREALARLLSALDAGRMPLRYQPIVPIQDEPGRLPHIEILLGLTQSDGTPVSAADLISAAEQYHQGGALDRLVIRETLRWMASHPEEVAGMGACAINLSGQSLSEDGLVSYVVDQLMQTRVPPGKVIFEVTETAAVVGLSNALELIRTLRDLGCRFALDDFGSGHVSYAYLKTLPVDFVKIDGFFVRGMAENAHDYAVVKSIHEIARVMGKLTVAEYVHSPEIIERLKAIGVDYAQGFLLGEPRMLMAPDAYGNTLPLPGTGDAEAADATVQLSA